MDTDQNINNNQQAGDELDQLAKEAQNILSEIESARKDAEEKMDEIEKQVDKTALTIERLGEDLDDIDSQAADSLDKMIIEGSEDPDEQP